MKMNQEGRQARARMETAKTESEKKFNPDAGPRRYRLYDKIKENVSLRTIDTIIIVTSLLIVGLLVYGIVTGTPQQ
ncbi:MAG: hypothetical protein E7319_04905 [Clostridiales bacterium]|nr:hypothetical protein [Clostridiales bacterium]